MQRWADDGPVEPELTEEKCHEDHDEHRLHPGRSPQRFLGLPDLKPMQEKLIQEMQERLMAGMQAADPQELLKSWFPATTGFDQMQAFFAQLAGTKPK